MNIVELIRKTRGRTDVKCDNEYGRSYYKYFWQDGCKGGIMNMVELIIKTHDRTDVKVG